MRQLSECSVIEVNSLVMGAKFPLFQTYATVLCPYISHCNVFLDFVEAALCIIVCLCRSADIKAKNANGKIANFCQFIYIINV